MQYYNESGEHFIRKLQQCSCIRIVIYIGTDLLCSYDFEEINIADIPNYIWISNGTDNIYVPKWEEGQAKIEDIETNDITYGDFDEKITIYTKKITFIFALQKG